MWREIKKYGEKENCGFPLVQIMDVRDINHGEYSVEVWTGDGGMQNIYSSRDLQKCIDKAESAYRNWKK